MQVEFTPQSNSDRQHWIYATIAGKVSGFYCTILELVTLRKLARSNANDQKCFEVVSGIIANNK